MSQVFTKDSSFFLLSGETLLEGLEREGYEVEYQCRAGYCGSCRVPILKGEVVYTQEPLAFVQPHEILPCCCRPVDSVQLDISFSNHHKNKPKHDSDVETSPMFDSF